MNIPSIVLMIALVGSGSASPDLPVYPGAKPFIYPHGISKSARTMCGSRIHLDLYTVSGTEPAAIAKWYADRMPGGIRIVQSPAVKQIYASDGSFSIAATRFGGGPTNLSLEAYQPRLSGDVRQVLAEAGRAASETSLDNAREKLARKCPDIEK